MMQVRSFGQSLCSFKSGASVARQGERAVVGGAARTMSGILETGCGLSHESTQALLKHSKQTEQALRVLAKYNPTQIAQRHLP